VAGVPSAYFGEDVMAWGRIVDGSPMTVTGKVQTYRLRELAAAA
jgi:hypothetical protein